MRLSDRSRFVQTTYKVSINGIVMDISKNIFAMFPGQGSQKIGMGGALLANFPKAVEFFDIAEAQLGFSLRQLCLEGPMEQLTMTENAQPAILTVSTIAYEALISSHDARPVVAAGHSLGEYSALVAAKAISFADAVLLVHKRGRYMQEAVPVGTGKMVAVLGKEIAEIEDAITKVTDGVAEIANINAPGQVVVSGDVAGVSAFVASLGKARVIELPVSAPFHSSLMKPAEIRLTEDLKSIQISKPQFPVFSNYSAEPLTDPEEIRKALALQVCGRVRWVECVQRARESFEFEQAVEVGEGNTLVGLMKRIDSSIPNACFSGGSN